MTRILENTKIGFRISLALALPVMGLLFFSGFTAVEKFQSAREMGKVLTLAELAPTISGHGVIAAAALPGVPEVR